MSVPEVRVYDVTSCLVPCSFKGVPPGREGCLPPEEGSASPTVNRMTNDVCFSKYYLPLWSVIISIEIISFLVSDHRIGDFDFCHIPQTVLIPTMLCGGSLFILPFKVECKFTVLMHNIWRFILSWSPLCSQSRRTLCDYLHWELRAGRVNNVGSIAFILQTLFVHR